MKDHKIGFKLSKKNFENLYMASKQAAIAHNYGLACSLNILASEELIKSFFLHLKALHPNVNFIDMDKIFRDHIHKHKELKNFLTIASENSETFEFNILKGGNEDFELLPIEMAEKFRRENAENEKIKRTTIAIKNSNISIDDIIAWLNQANEEKNLGLYVGFSQNAWQSPKDFTKRRFRRELKFTKLLKLHFRNAVRITNFLVDFEINKEEF